jgi:hypothetical protein
MSRIDEDHLTVVDAVGHGSDGEHVVGQRFPIDPPFGLVAMAWRDDAAIDRWLRGVTPRLTRTDIEPLSAGARRCPRTQVRSLAVRRRPRFIARPSRGNLGIVRADCHGGTAADQPDDDGHP